MNVKLKVPTASFTLDTNCLIDVDERRSPKDDVLYLVEMHKQKKIDVAYVAQSASERQRGGLQIQNYREFVLRLERLQLSSLTEILTLMYGDISFWDRAVWGDDESVAREKLIHKTLFPRHAFMAPESEESNGSGHS